MQKNLEITNDYFYNVEKVRRERIFGWIVDKKVKTRRLTVKLFIDNEFVMQTENSIERKDIESALGVLKAGFNFKLPKIYAALDRLRIDIKLEDVNGLVSLLSQSIVLEVKRVKKNKVIAVLGLPNSGMTQLVDTIVSNSQSSSWFLPYETRKNLKPSVFTNFASLKNKYKECFPYENGIKDTIVLSESTSSSENIKYIINSLRNLSENGVETKVIWLIRDVNHCYLSDNTSLRCWSDNNLTKKSYHNFIDFAREGYSQLVYFFNQQEHIMVSYNNLVNNTDKVVKRLMHHIGISLTGSQFNVNSLNLEYIDLWKKHQKLGFALNEQLELFVKEFNNLEHTLQSKQFYNLTSYTEELLDSNFNKKYYLKIYPDIAKANIDPFEHYMNHGWKENRDPSINFNTKRYRENVHNGKFFNPFVHYNLIGRFDMKADNFVKQNTLLDLIVINPEDYEITEKLLLEAPYFENPEVSIVIPTYNQKNYTLACIESIIKNTKDVSYEIIVADDKSPDIEARELSKYFKNIVFTSNENNMGFLLNCKNAVKFSKGKYLHFLNNDTNVQPGWLSSLIDIFKTFDNVGMVGSKLVYSDGRQQDAGGIVWDDASAWNFGRLDGVDNTEYNYVRESDYVTGASMLISKVLWDKIGGFDERYVPAYYEDTDLAFEVRKHGYKTMFQPKSIVVHFEGISNGTDLESGTKQYQVLNREKFFNKWKDELKENHFPNGKELFLARDRSSKKKHMLFVDHYLPHYDEDAGSKVAYQYLQMFAKSNMQVHFLGDNFDNYPDTPYLDALTQKGIEVLYGNWYRANWDEWFKENGKYFNYVVLSRPHISVKYMDVIRSHSKAKVIYFGHDLHFLREHREYKVKKDEKYLRGSENWKKIELDLIKQADVSYFFSMVEKEEILKVLPKASVDVVPLYIYNKFIEREKFSSERKNIMFVGGFNHTPNIDAMLWFVKEVWPYIEQAVKGIHFYIIGSNPSGEVLALAKENITVTGFVEDDELDVYYENCKVAVAPLRYGAGVKGKVVDALYNGMPMVTTSVGAEGLENCENVLMVADDAQKFAKKVVLFYKNSKIADEFSKRASKYSRNNFSKKVAKEKISNIFSEFGEKIDGN